VTKEALSNLTGGPEIVDRGRRTLWRLMANKNTAKDYESRHDAGRTLRPQLD
jgi:hypothetical protein